MVLIAPSLLAADFGRLALETAAVADAGAEGIMLSTITDALRAKFKDFKVRDLGYSQMRQYMASVGDYELEKSGRNFRVRLSQ